MTLVIDLDNGETVYATRFRDASEKGLAVLGYQWGWHDDPCAGLCEESRPKWIVCEVEGSKHPTLIAVRHIIRITKVDA